VFLCCVVLCCVVLSSVDRGLCNRPITRAKEAYQVSLRIRNFRCEEAKVLTRTVEPLMMMINIIMT
jgi:hypothetical protein